MLNRTWYIMFSDKRSQSINSVADWFGYDGVVMGVKNDKGTKLWVAGAGSKAEMNEGESAPYTVDTGCGHGRSGYVVADSAFKVGKDKGVGSFADWGRFVQMEKDGTPFDDFVFYFAADMISYWGGQCEPDNDTNYWDMLGIHGITYRNYI